MRMIDILYGIYRRHILKIMFIVSFVVWWFCFRGFLSGRLALTHDATPFYDHIKFYLDNITRGVYPLWDPYRQGGVPNDFFLRRIGSYNPFLFFIAALNKMGLPYTQSYLWFLVSYHFLGMVGFYALARRVVRHVPAAFTAYLLLLFSSLGARLFDSYLVFVTTPLLWFFYFLTMFTQQPRKHLFVGMILTSMILLNTYIPFYFVIIFCSFVFCFCALEYDRVKSIVMRYRAFVRKNKVLVFLCLVALALSLIPPALFYYDMNQGDLAMPGRHDPSSGGIALVAPRKQAVRWGALEEMIYGSHFLNLWNMRCDVFYLPVFAYLLLALGIVTALNTRLAFLLLWGLVLFVFGSPRVSSLYDFLYERVFFIKYFRNLFYFLWFALLPIVILFAAGQLRQLFLYRPQTQRGRRMSLSFVIGVHAIVATFFIFNRVTAVSTYIAIGTSAVLFILHLFRKPGEQLPFLLPLIFIAVVAQPLEAYLYLARNAQRYEAPYTYEEITPLFSLVKDTRRDARSLSDDETSSIYFGTRWLANVRANISYKMFLDYTRHAFILYDRVEEMDDEVIDWEYVADIFRGDINAALVAPQALAGGMRDAHRPLGAVTPIVEESAEFRVLDATVNSITIKTHFTGRKFLVYNNAFERRWRAYIDGQPAELMRANIAFQGLWVPPGERIIMLRYHSQLYVLFNFFLIGVFGAVFTALVWLSWGYRRERYAE